MKHVIITAGLGATALALAACGGSTTSESSGSPAVSGTSAAGSASSSVSSSCPLTVSDAWVKAADSGMTAAFGVVHNDSGTGATITAASTPASSSTQLHETVDSGGSMVMKQVQQFVVPASGTLTLEPGGNHIMLMDVVAPIQAGQDVSFTLTCSGGGTASFTAQARTFNGADETYQSGSPMPSMSGSMG